MYYIKNIPITFIEKYSDAEIDKILSSHKLINYVDRNLKHKNVEIKSIRIDKVNFFGSNVGFIYLESDIYVNNKKAPGIAFIRGDSVGILLVLKTKTPTNYIEEYTILVEQYRHNIGKFSKGIPAGMIDQEGQVTSTAIKEIEEEVGDLNIKEKDLKYLTEYFPSSGGCDEKMELYSASVFVEYNKLMNFQDRITGSEKENEEITLDVVKLNSLADFKAGTKANLAYSIFINNRI